jgi:hypothetical protein
VRSPGEQLGRVLYGTLHELVVDKPERLGVDMSFALLRWRTALACTALVTGCSSNDPAEEDAGGGDASPIEEPGTEPDPSHEPPPGPPPLVCSGTAATGSVLFSLDTGAGALTLRSDLAVDVSGSVFYVRGNSLAKYTTGGQLVFSVPYGEAVAVDAAGNAYVAASFTAAIDIGLGEMVPEGNVDVFVAKLAPDGRPLFARPLRLCGDGVRSIAVAADGRIAVSGGAMGTVVLDAQGKLMFERAFSGDVAFDSTGALIVAGEVRGTIYFGSGAGFTTAGDLDGFIVKLDGHGTHVWSYRIGDADLPVRLLASGTLVTEPTRQRAAAVTIDAQDNVIVVGQFDYDIKLFGTDSVAALVDIASVSLRAGTFTAVLASNGSVINAGTTIGFDGLADVAVDAKGRMLVTGMELAEASPPFRYAFLSRTVAGLPGIANQIGAGLAVVADACGNVFWSASIRVGGADQPMTSKLIKLAN